MFMFCLQEERQKRLGPGGLDPVEVFETLPKVQSTFRVLGLAAFWTFSS